VPWYSCDAVHDIAAQFLSFKALIELDQAKSIAKRQQ